MHLWCGAALCCRGRRGCFPRVISRAERGEGSFRDVGASALCRVATPMLVVRFSLCQTDRFWTGFLPCHPHRAFWRTERGVVHFGGSRGLPVRCFNPGGQGELSNRVYSARLPASIRRKLTKAPPPLPYPDLPNATEPAVCAAGRHAHRGKPLIFANCALYGASQIHDAGSGDPAYRGL